MKRYNIGQLRVQEYRNTLVHDNKALKRLYQKLNECRKYRFGSICTFCTTIVQKVQICLNLYFLHFQKNKENSIIDYISITYAKLHFLHFLGGI